MSNAIRDASVNSIFEGLKWLNLGWDEEYKQSERLALHQKTAWAIFEKGLAYRDFTPAHTGDAEKSGAQGTWLFNPGMRELSREESDRRAAAGSPLRCASGFRGVRRAGTLRRCRLRGADQSGGRYRRLRAASLRRHADLSPGFLRR